VRRRLDPAHRPSSRSSRVRRCRHGAPVPMQDPRVEDDQRRERHGWRCHPCRRQRVRDNANQARSTETARVTNRALETSRCRRSPRDRAFHWAIRARWIEGRCRSLTRAGARAIET
jgi:transposase-like protein